MIWWQKPCKIGDNLLTINNVFESLVVRNWKSLQLGHLYFTEFRLPFLAMNRCSCSMEKSMTHRPAFSALVTKNSALLPAEVLVNSV